MKQVYNRALGRLVWVNDDGSPVSPQNDPMGVNPGLGSLPNRALLREIDIASRLPDAQLAGYRGPSVVEPKPMRGARPEDPEPAPVPTYRPLAGAKQNSRGNSVIMAPDPLGGFGAGATLSSSIVETSRNSGDDAEILSVVCGVAPKDFQSFQDALAANGADVSFTGILTWGIGGASFQAEFDWRNGLAFSVAASFLRLRCRYDYVQDGLNRGPSFVISAAMGYGNVFGNPSSPLRKTQVIADTIPAGSSYFAVTGQYIAIPEWARSFVVLQRNNPPTTTDLSIVQISGPAVLNRIGNFRVNNITTAVNLTETAIPVLNGARAIDIGNSGPVGTEVTILWNLSL